MIDPWCWISDGLGKSQECIDGYRWRLSLGSIMMAALCGWHVVNREKF